MMAEAELRDLIRKTYGSLSRAHDEIDALLDAAGVPRREPCKVVRLHPEGCPISENITYRK